VHDKQMSDTDTGLKRMKWIKVAPGKWREDAEVAIVQRPKRARALPFNDKKVADFKNWLDFLTHMDHDAYITLMRYMVGTGVIEYNRKDLRNWAYRTYVRDPRVIGTFIKHSDSHEINIYGLRYLTTSTYLRSEPYFKHVDIPSRDHQIFPSGASRFFDKKKFFEKNNLLAAAEANGIKVYKSWSKPRLWKALLSA
jgi:hypothetical protein